MKALILAAGYGTRLERDILADCSLQFAHLVGIPKPLLPVGGKPLISRWTNALRDVKDIDEVFVVTNALFLKKFQEWSTDWPEVQILCDGSTTNEGRLGAVAAIQLCIDQIRNSGDDLLVIAGDTLFLEDFSLKGIVECYLQRRHKTETGGLVLRYKCSDSETSKFGILEIDSDDKVTAFLEKPGPDVTTSRWACPCCYIISHNSLELVKEFLNLKKDCPLKERDAPGNFIRYLAHRASLYTTRISGRFDVGGLQSYLECNKHFSSH